MLRLRSLSMISVVVAATAVACSLCAVPPTSQPMDPLGKAASPATQPTVDQTAKHRLPQVDRLDKQVHQLELTDEQKPKIDPIMERLQQRLEAINSDVSIPAADRKDKMTEGIKSAMQDLKQILTPEQVTQLKQLRQEATDAPAKGKGKKGAK